MRNQVEFYGGTLFRNGLRSPSRFPVENVASDKDMGAGQMRIDHVAFFPSAKLTDKRSMLTHVGFIFWTRVAGRRI